MANGHIQVKVEGLDQLRRAFRELPLNVQKRVIARSVGKGADVIRDEVSAGAPLLAAGTPYRKPGTLKRAIYAIVGKRSSDDSEATAFVGIRKLTARAVAAFKRKNKQSAAHNPDDAFYWKFLEFGTAKMSARPFVRPGFDRKKEAAVKVIQDDLRQGVQDEAAKLAWKL